MAEVKNTFIQSKMNQDLDGRILPNGQYRFGKNISISRSDAADVGALENVLGTELLTGFGLDDCAYEIIGHFVDFTNDRIFLFITDYTDNSANKLDNNITGQNSVFGYINKNCFIAMFNDRDKTGSLLVGGDFLNFAKNFPITGVNLLEDLLFWTDNRNQPRKINVTTAISNPFELGSSPGYYTNEDHISVAKYYPFEAISLLKNEGGPLQWISTMTNKSEEYLPTHCAAAVDVTMGAPGFTCVLDGVYNNIEVGYEVSGVNIANGVTISNVTPNVPAGKTTITWIGSTLNLNQDKVLYFKAPNPDYDDTWPGDKVYLEDKFVRFSYRFQFDDGEYSLIAPFTQACFVPKQDGYFIGKDVDTLAPPEYATGTGVSKTLIGDEGNAYASTIVEFFENKIQDIELYIPCARVDKDQILFEQLQEQLKVKAIEIIYKESESTTAYVLDTVEAEDFNSVASSFYQYNYQSRKPWKTLRERDLIRVYDKVPIRALAQESSGNRIIYGNYIDKHTSPKNLTYTVGIDQKIEVPSLGDPGFGDPDFYVRKEYQNHTLKQNRTYQVGVVLSDRYGRQSDVILSDVFDEVIGGYGSTIYHPYRDIQSTLIDNTNTWPGDQINITWYDVIPDVINQEGYPGLYSNNNGKLQALIPGTSSLWSPGCLYCWTATGAVSGATATFTAQVTLAGEIDSSTIIITSSTTGWQENEPVIIGDTCGCPVGVYSDWTASASINQNTLGWYSWKIVVKQTEQDYYNCYLPGMLAGYPLDIKGIAKSGTTEAVDEISFPKGDDSKISHVVLINDNINKIPRDLNQPGPTQQVFGSSVQLFGRVENYKYLDSAYMTYNRQFDPGVNSDTVVTIGTLSELGLGKLVQAGTDNQLLNPEGYPTVESLLVPINFFNGEQDPLVARISTTKEIGWPNVDGGNTPGMMPYLSIYETKPITSNLDIYWETSTSGLIKDLNYSIINEDNTIPVGITEPSIDLVESQAPDTICSAEFTAVAANGTELDAPALQTTVELASVVNGYGVDIKYKFQLDLVGPGNIYQLKTAFDPDGYFTSWQDETKRTLTFTFKILRPGVPGLAPPVNFDVNYTAKIGNAAPNQVGMYDSGLIPGSNNAREDIKQAGYEVGGQYGGVQTRPPMIVVPETDCGTISSGGSNNYFAAASGTMPATSQQLIGWYEQATGLPNSPPVRNGDYIIGCQDPNAVVTNVWDGVFKSWNGAYSSDPATPFPVNPDRGSEIVYSVARAYQVSCYFGNNNLLMYEFAFSKKNGVGEPWALNIENPSFNLSLPCSGGFCEFDGFISPAPNGPVYAEGPSAISCDPADFTGACQGEEEVGQRYNLGNHYWVDLEAAKAVNASIMDLKTPFTAGSHPMDNPTDVAGFWYVERLQYNTVQGKFYIELGQANVFIPNQYAGFIAETSLPPSPYQPQEGRLRIGQQGLGNTGDYILPATADTSMPTTLPPGRYIVTMRATDRSTLGPNGAGLYFEWDVPVIVPGPFVVAASAPFPFNG